LYLVFTASVATAVDRQIAATTIKYKQLVNFTTSLPESVTCHPAEVTFPPLAQQKQVLDVATLKGCKAELTSVVVVTYLR